MHANRQIGALFLPSRSLRGVCISTSPRGLFAIPQQNAVKGSKIGFELNPASPTEGIERRQAAEIPGAPH
jgi:hypothetical protein